MLFCSRSDRSRCNQWRCVRIATANYQINEEIRDKEVRVIGADGAQLGIMSSAAALEIAIEKDLDLVKIAPGSNTNIGEQLLRDFAAKCADIANLDKQPKLEGRNMSMFLSPKAQNTNNKK